MRSEFAANITAIRAIEDCIRATKKYTEGIRTIRKAHPAQQGEDSINRVFCKHYEVYPDTKISWDMPAGTALDWLWGDVTCIDVLFRYDYRVNRASVEIRDGPVAVKELARAIPGFASSIAVVVKKDEESQRRDTSSPTVYGRRLSAPD